MQTPRFFTKRREICELYSAVVHRSPVSACRRFCLVSPGSDRLEAKCDTRRACISPREMHAGFEC